MTKEEKYETNEIELKLMFHTLGYDFTPRWNDEKGGFRNYFYTHENTSDYLIIKGLIDKGYMIDNGVPGFGGDGRCYSCTNKANSVVVDLWLKKKKENKPSSIQRRTDYYKGFQKEMEYMTKEEKDYVNFLEKKIRRYEEIIDSIYCATNLLFNEKERYLELKNRDIKAPKLVMNHACDTCKNSLCQDRDIFKPIPKQMCKGYVEIKYD